MPTLNWIGKEAVANHDKEVPFRLLKKIKSASLGNNSQNLIIHGDNLEALKALMPFYANKIKCIYIDPPYNTGNENWVYNDKVNSPKIKKWLKKVVKSEDLCRHDKWLCMMYPRLKLLKDFLSDDGAIFISIDDNEHCNLRSMLDEIFGENNFVESFIWKSRLGKGATSKTTAKLHEYVVAYAKNINLLKFKTDKRVSNKESKERLRQWGQGDKREDRPTMYYPIYSKKFGQIYPQKPDGTDGRWRISKSTMMELIAKKIVIFEKQDDGRIEAYRIIPAGTETNTAYSSIFDSEIVKTTAHGSIEIKNLLGENKFSYPKPSTLIKEILSLCTQDSDIILDTFAGSGTTGHAVLDLNNEKGGTRRFILVEMEDDVAKDITAERVKKVIINQRYDDGFEFCELDKPLFDNEGQIDKECTFKQLASYIYFTETQTNIDDKNIKNTFIGDYNGTDYHLLYTEKDKNILNKSFLKNIDKNENKKIIYADKCLIDDDTLNKYHIQFKQIPYEIIIY
jgi:adenine specific DNA methylase Mod